MHSKKQTTKGGTEDDGCSIPNLLYKFNWRMILNMEVAIWKNQQPATVFPKTINIGQCWDTMTLATEAPPAINLPSSRKFSCLLMITNLLSHVQLFSLALFCSTSTQTVLMCMVSSNRVQRSLAVETLNCWCFCVQCRTHPRGYELNELNFIFTSCP